MNEFIGKSGRDIYLISKDTGEACKFNSFGEKTDSVDVGFAILSSKYLGPVDILSVVGEPSSPVCEVYFGGKVAVIRGNYFEVYGKLREIRLMDSSVPLRIMHNDNAMQILMPYKKGSISKSFIDGRFPNLIWENLF